MTNHNNPPGGQSEGSKTSQAKRRIIEIAYDSPMSCRMLEEATGLHHNSLRFLIGKMKSSGTLFDLEKRLCYVTKRAAMFYTSKPRNAGLCPHKVPNSKE